MCLFKRLGILMLLAAVGVMAQDAPKAELFGGYSYSRVQAGSGLSGINLNGWNASITGNVNSWFGVTADFSGHYGSPSGTKVNRHSFLFGPRLTFRGHDKVNPFVHVLFGGVRGHRSITPAGPPPPLPQLPPVSETAFGMVLGGGMDVKVGNNFAIRVVQADYLLTRFDQPSGIFCITVPCPTTIQGTQHNLRLSFGIVWRSGGK